MGKGDFMNRETITIFGSCLNEEKNLPAFLESNRWADEIIILDSGSTDRSAEICAQYKNCTVYLQKLEGSFNGRSIFSISKTKTDWCFFSDPDEFITEELRQEIQIILENDTEYAAFEFPRINFFMDKPLRHGGWSSNGLKMFRRDSVHFEGDSYHEHPIIDGKIGQLKGEVWHYQSPTIHWVLQKFNYISEFECQEYFNQQGMMSERKFKWILFSRPFKIFWKCYIKKKGYKDGLHGLIYAMMIWAFDVIRMCKYAERYIVKNPNIHSIEELPDPWKCRKH